MAVLDFLKSLLAKAPETIAGKRDNSFFGVDIGLSSVKVVQVRNDRGRVILETYGELATGPYGGLAVGQAAALSSDKAGQLIKDLLREANVTATRGAIAIPLRSSLIIDANIPEVDDEKLATMIPLEARKYVPVPISEVSLDWLKIPVSSDSRLEWSDDKNKHPSTKILIVAIQNDTISQTQDAAKRAGFTPTFFEIETFSSIRSTLRGDLGATAILDIGAGTSKLAIVDRGVVRVSHTISKGAQDITVAVSHSLGVPFAKAEEIKREVGLVARSGTYGELESVINPSVDYVFAETSRVMVKYQKENRRSVDKLILIGGGALLKGISEIAAKTVGVPVALGTPFDKTETPAFLGNILTEAGPVFAVALGLALRGLEEN
jgi:type IV pilus assembly protein PilM